MMVKTRNGLFSNEGYGGGVFNGNTAFGSVETHARGISGLGAVSVGQGKTIPWQCWDAAGFKACHAKAYDEAKSMCSYCAGAPNDPFCKGWFDGNVPGCIEANTNDMAWMNCVPNFCPKQDPGMANIDVPEYVVGSPCNAPNTIKSVQFKIGAKPDGNWGPLSTEAYKVNQQTFNLDYCDLAPGCTGDTPMGAPCGKAAEVTPTPIIVPAPPTPQPPAPVIIPPKPAMKTGSLIVGGLLLAGALGGIAYAMKKRK